MGEKRIQDCETYENSSVAISSDDDFSSWLSWGKFCVWKGFDIKETNPEKLNRL